MIDKYDAWENTNNAGTASRILVKLMCENKPNKKTHLTEYDQWEKEMSEVRKWCISIHERRIDLNMRDLKSWRETVV